MSGRDWWDLTRIDLAEDFGWTLDYIDSLPIEDIRKILAVKTARSMAREKEAPQSKGRGATKKS